MADGRRLILVVGASGAGKDSLIRGAHAALAGCNEVVFPRRVITRPADASGTEDHEPCDAIAFQQRLAAGAFALHWTANGLSYGVPVHMEHDLAAGRAVVVNVSRSIVPAAERRYPGLCVCVICASAAVRAARLHQRGREAGEDVAARLHRAGAFTITAREMREICNDGPLAVGVRALVDIILARLDDTQVPAAASG
jgi:phosphonate metabolism protein PhnN/1,5-bisphosphokinase (PRPP-forming)